MARSRIIYLILATVAFACCCNLLRGDGGSTSTHLLRSYILTYPDKSTAIKVHASNVEELVEKATKRASPKSDEEVIVTFNETIHGRSFRLEVDSVTFPEIPTTGLLDVIYERRSGPVASPVQQQSAGETGIDNRHIKEKYSSKEWKGYPLQHDDRDLIDRDAPLTPEQEAAGCRAKIRKYHTITTSVGSIYDTWIMRVSYHWWKLQKEKDVCNEMGGFTRLLHSGKPDDHMLEIPTLVVPRLDPDSKCNKTGEVKCDLGFIVINRPHAMSVLLKMMEAQKFFIAEKWILLLEPDHLILKPPASIPRATFSFSYMRAPADSTAEIRMQEWLPKGLPASELPPGGPSPCLLHLDDWKKITPHWLEVSFQMQREYQFQQLFGWVLEMWGFLAAAVHVGIELNAHDYQIEPCGSTGWVCPETVVDAGDGSIEVKLANWIKNSQMPPFIMHVTQSMDYSYDGIQGIPENSDPMSPPWSFNKRHYTGLYPPPNLSPPPKIRHAFPGLAVEMVNHASANIPTWGVIPGVANGTYGRDTCKLAPECKKFARTYYLRDWKVGPKENT